MSESVASREEVNLNPLSLTHIFASIVDPAAETFSLSEGFGFDPVL